jgi:tetratricopeptide (TPR) repeat protein
MLSEAHVSLAQISLRYDHDWEDTERRYKRAIELDPGNSTAHHWYAYDLMCRARFDEAIKEMKRAYELDPLSLIINRNLGQVYYRAGQYDKALEALQKTHEMDPNFSFVHYYQGLVYLQKSMYEEALAEFQMEREKAKGWGTRAEAMIGIAYFKLGMRDKAQEILNELIVKSEQVYVQPTSIAILYFVMDENEQGFKWLDKAYEEYDSNLRLIRVDTFYEPVRSDPRFKEMMKKAGVES